MRNQRVVFCVQFSSHFSDSYVQKRVNNAGYVDLSHFEQTITCELLC